ncbi:hypothetical protein OG21DRAFT_818605 [Imleria badia]|nr:hypothetical protein OG21DRAFT_818605 [Imleria badia]
MEVDQDNASTANTATIIEEKETKKFDGLGRIDDILKWLDGLSCAPKQEETLSLRQPDTCTWLHSTPKYESWKNSDDSFLWLQGKRGHSILYEVLITDNTYSWIWEDSVGVRSPLMSRIDADSDCRSFVVDSIKHKRRSGEELAFFYCDFRNDRSTSAARSDAFTSFSVASPT